MPERNPAARLARKKAVRDRPRVIGDLSKLKLSKEQQIARLKKQFDAMPGPPKGKFMVFLNTERGYCTYPIYGGTGFMAAIKDAINKHQEMDMPMITGGWVQGQHKFLKPSAELDAQVVLMACGAQVLVVNKVEND